MDPASHENASRLPADAYDTDRAGSTLLPEGGLLPHLFAAAYQRALGRPFTPHRSIDAVHATCGAAAAAAAHAPGCCFGEASEPPRGSKLMSLLRRGSQAEVH